MRILVVATKPPWPPRDGGRLALWLTLQGLAEAGHEIALVAPVDLAAPSADVAALRAVCIPHLVPVARPNWVVAAAGALRHNRALTVVRHRSAKVERAVSACLSSWRPDVLHAEQLQAFANCDPARAAGVSTLLRMQNVESSLWRQVALARLGSRPLLLEARRLSADEARAMARATRVVALTERDAVELRCIGGSTNPGKVVAVSPPFPSWLPAGPAVAGDPAVVLAGSGGWWPNEDGASWFLRRVTRQLMVSEPAVRVHVFGGAPTSFADGLRTARRGVIAHPAPDDAVAAFPAGSIAAIPLHIGSGIRMRILEAWARGLPVVATTAAAAGLHIESGGELLLADTPAHFASAILSVVREPAIRAGLVARGRAYLDRYHNRQTQTQALLKEYELARRDVLE